jgi:hypothetical protein
MDLNSYINNINQRFRLGNATEHTFRGDLQQLLEAMVPKIRATNETQYFEDVPEVAWDFYIGGYQPAQKWLKDRKDRELHIDDIRHCMKIIVALTETDSYKQVYDDRQLDNQST